MFKAGIFDVGGVLHKSPMEYVKKDIKKTLGLSADIFDFAWNKINPLFETGKITEDEFWSRFIALTKSKKCLPQESLLTREFIKHYTPNHFVIKLVKQMKKNGYKLAILSETNALYAAIHYKNGLYDKFDKIILSYNVGLMKTNKKIFQLALEQLGTSPTETFFVDDNKKYVSEAKQMGLHAILFKNERQLEKELRELKIL